MIFQLSCFNVFAPINKVKTSPTYVNASSILSLAQQVRQNIRTRITNNQLILSHSVSVRRSITNISVGNTLFINQNGQKTPTVESPYNGFIMWHVARTVIWEKINQPFVITQGIVDNASTLSQNIFVPTQSVIHKLIKNIVIEHTLTLHSLNSVFNSALGWQYISPTITPLTNSLTDVSFTFGSYSFSVHQPDFNNSESLEFSRVKRTSRAGDLIIFRDNKWPQSQILKLTFSWLKESEKEKFRTLVQISLGQLITYVDHFGQTWSCIITNPQTDIIQTGRKQWQVHMELQGSKL